MSRYRTVQEHLEQLDELQAIIGSMKTLSQIELHKLGELAGGQEALAASLARMASDFYHHNPQPEPQAGEALWLLLGSERGFCGDFNAGILRHLLEQVPAIGEQPARVMALGRKLWPRIEEALPGFTPLAGVNVSEELAATLAHTVNAIREQMEASGASVLYVLYHDSHSESPTMVRLLPPQLGEGAAKLTTPPLLQLPPLVFLREFLLHYLYLALHRLFSQSLLVENRHRVRHLEGAVERLDERLGELTTRARSLRQEEITEEIEMILLGSEMAGVPGAYR